MQRSQADAFGAWYPLLKNNRELSKSSQVIQVGIRLTQPTRKYAQRRRGTRKLCRSPSIRRYFLIANCWIFIGLVLILRTQEASSLIAANRIKRRFIITMK